jgi:hypothetical protein
MPDIQLGRFATAVAVLNLFKDSPTAPLRVTVVETNTTLRFRPHLDRVDVGLVIPKARPGGVTAYTAHEVASDVSEGVELGTFLALEDVQRLLRGVRIPRRRHESPGYARLDGARITLQGPGSQLPIISALRWTDESLPRRLPVYLTAGSAGNRISGSVLNAMGQAGRKISPTGTWSVQDGRWVIQDSQGTALRVATW